MEADVRNPFSTWWHKYVWPKPATIDGPERRSLPDIMSAEVRTRTFLRMIRPSGPGGQRPTSQRFTAKGRDVWDSIYGPRGGVA